MEPQARTLVDISESRAALSGRAVARNSSEAITDSRISPALVSAPLSTPRRIHGSSGSSWSIAAMAPVTAESWSSPSAMQARNRTRRLSCRIN